MRIYILFLSLVLTTNLWGYQFITEPLVSFKKYPFKCEVEMTKEGEKFSHTDTVYLRVIKNGSFEEMQFMVEFRHAVSHKHVETLEKRMGSGSIWVDSSVSPEYSFEPSFDYLDKAKLRFYVDQKTETGTISESRCHTLTNKEWRFATGIGPTLAEKRETYRAKVKK